MERQTELLHTADNPHQWAGAVNTPVVRASLFCYESFQQYLDAGSGKARHYNYSRVANPTTHVLEKKIAFLEKADDAVALASGMAAITSAILAFVHKGDHLLVVSCVYGPVRNFCDQTLRRLGIETDYFSPEEAVDLAHRVKPNTRLIYLESPGSVTFDLQDLRAVARLARERGILTLIDNTWATPLYQNPIEMGIDLVIHSGTKYIGGHSDVLLGLVAGSADLMSQVRTMGIELGGTISPDDAYLATRGLRTLSVRMPRHQESALHIARWLEAQPEVVRVLHPGLESFPGHTLAKAQMSGYSGLFGFQLRPRSRAAQARFVDATLSLFYLACSWGGYESLIIPVMGLDSHTYRLSIGLEDPDDLIEVLRQAIEAYTAED